jgi:hypothetical protein
MRLPGKMPIANKFTSFNLPLLLLRTGNETEVLFYITTTGMYIEFIYMKKQRQYYL